MSGSNGSMKSLVDLTVGEISREIFVNKDIYEQEKEHIFGTRLALRGP